MEEKEKIYITISGRNYYSWQGSVAYNGKVSAFCSELELIKILESYLPPVSVIMEFRGEEENK
ncbi:hypothetical protein C3B58_14880 [Lactonifactor longoviformis]|uniref:Uncharacterized protein n=1 Tax=Lactonifactor longoviformis DSM 17459 TaxID=1122155 RepID=A0A1M4T8R2_9CLOT|nr:hypothetical protein [Lactonifactor longoviformis]POP31785.1 hypothetical protein C3B58_14880 [Lactonifactor longoviformis]SHE40800.1 hypothetical protein SAMN02745158_00478 [Lactonifactor longoviformis DSM 17459]